MMEPMLEDPASVRILEFLCELGIATEAGEISEPTFLPGIQVRNGTLVIDNAKLRYPGDLLHEAGHLAVLPAAQRVTAGAELGDDGGLEMAAIAWSWAAALHLGIDPTCVLHDDGYKGDAASIRENFIEGRYFGVPLLQWMGLTAEPKHAARIGVEPYPKMQRWLRD